jgi:ABC-type antimicrobial peptide transport system, permease component
MFFVRSKGDTEGTRAEILKLNPQNRIRSMSEYVTLMNSSNLPELKPFIRTMVGLGIVVSFLVVLMNMHTMILERTREIGILKALGFSRFDIVKMLLGETAVLTVIGSLVGIAITLVTQGVLKETNPGLSILLTPGWILARWAWHSWDQHWAQPCLCCERRDLTRSKLSPTNRVPFLVLHHPRGNLN